MINDRKVYNVKIYSDELLDIVAVLLDKVKEIKIKMESQEESIEKDLLKSNVNKYLTIITRLNTGILYNDDCYEKNLNDNLNFGVNYTKEN